MARFRTDGLQYYKGVGDDKFEEFKDDMGRLRKRFRKLLGRCSEVRAEGKLWQVTSRG